MTGVESTNIQTSGQPRFVADPQLRPLVSQSKPKRSYFIRHWRGELSLPLSYWVNSILATIAVAFLSIIVGAFAQPTEGVLFWAALVLLVWIFAVIASGWQLVGVWRSAGTHKSRGGSGFWAGVARFMVVLGFLNLTGTLVGTASPQLVSVFQIVAGDNKLGKHTLTILRGGTELEFSGGITFGSTDEVRQALDMAPSVKVLHLNSQGGRVAEARKMSELITERKLITYVSNACMSACTIAFLGGTQRYAAPDARIGFHQVDFPGLTSQELAAENESERRSLMQHGVPAWFAERAYSTPNNSMWSPSLEQLKQANVITAVARSGDFALSGLPRDINSEGLKADLLKVPTFAAINKADPQAYSQILSIVNEAVKLGKSQAELNSMATPIVGKVTKKYIPVASDTAVMDVTEVFIAEMDAIEAKNPEACYRFINPQPGGGAVFVGDYISKDLLQRDIAASAEVIETGATNPAKIPTEAQVSKSLEEVFRRLAANHSAEDLDILANLGSSTVEHKRVCPIVADLFREIITLPAQERIGLLRYMFAQ